MAPTPLNILNKPKKHYFLHKRTRIAALFSVGLLAKAIAVKEAIPQRTVYDINNRYKIQKFG
jgi:hypothetical protein